jgi:hypothetical protein
MNHLGWVQRVRMHGDDVTAQWLSSDALLSRSFIPWIGSSRK